MLEYWLWLAHRPGIDEHMKVLLLQYFGSPQGVYQAQPGELAEVSGLTGAGRKALSDKNLSLYSAALERCRQDGIKILTYLDEQYPRRLKNIYHPPLVLYCKGTLPPFDSLPAVGVVGTRRCSAYGLAAAGRLGREISRCGGLVVSGLADGIDASAMKGALQEGAATVGVLGCGADVVYPACNRALFAQVERCGCILSEFMPGTAGFKWNFPKRNRIISGLSLGVVIVEAPEGSGALHTARFALEQGRDVFAVPGNIDIATFAGSNRLLREGAFPVTCGWDVMEEYTSLFPDKIRKAASPVRKAAESEPMEKSPPKRKDAPPVPVKKDIDNSPQEAYIDVTNNNEGLSDRGRAIVACLAEGEKPVDQVISATGIPSGLLLRELTVLELSGTVARLPGGRIRLGNQGRKNK